MVQTGDGGGDAEAERIIGRGYVGETVGESLGPVRRDSQKKLGLGAGLFLHGRPLLGLSQAAQIARNRLRHLDS